MKSLIDEEVGKDEPETSGVDYIIVIRNLLILAAVIMLLTLPFFNNKLGIPFEGAVLGIVLLIVCAGLTTARRKWTVIIDLIVSGSSLIIFEYYAVMIYNAAGLFRLILFINQSLSLLFLFAFLYCIQALRKRTMG